MSKEELLELYREFGSEAQEALDFVVKNLPILKVDCDVSELPHDEGRIITIEKPGTISFEKPANGIYIIFKTGQYVPFEKDADYNKEDVKYIGIVHDGHAFAVGLKDLGEYPLVKDVDKCPEDHPLYRPRLCDALMDWDCIERTKHIQEIGTDIPLEEGEYIPSLPMLVVMCYYADKGLNDALESVGGEPLKTDEYYWCSTEGSRARARLVGFSSGYSAPAISTPPSSFRGLSSHSIYER